MAPFQPASVSAPEAEGPPDWRFTLPGRSKADQGGDQPDQEEASSSRAGTEGGSIRQVVTGKGVVSNVQNSSLNETIKQTDTKGKGKAKSKGGKTASKASNVQLQAVRSLQLLSFVLSLDPSKPEDVPVLNAIAEADVCHFAEAVALTADAEARARAESEKLDWRNMASLRTSLKHFRRWKSQRTDSIGAGDGPAEAPGTITVAESAAAADREASIHAAADPGLHDGDSAGAGHGRIGFPKPRLTDPSLPGTAPQIQMQPHVRPTDAMNEMSSRGQASARSKPFAHPHEAPHVAAQSLLPLSTGIQHFGTEAPSRNRHDGGQNTDSASLRVPVPSRQASGAGHEHEVSMALTAPANQTIQNRGVQLKFAPASTLVPPGLALPGRAQLLSSVLAQPRDDAGTAPSVSQARWGSQQGQQGQQSEHSGQQQFVPTGPNGEVVTEEMLQRFAGWYIGTRRSRPSDRDWF